MEQVTWSTTESTFLAPSGFLFHLKSSVLADKFEFSFMESVET